jgi:hypothetical protein
MPSRSVECLAKTGQTAEYDSGPPFGLTQRALQPARRSILGRTSVSSPVFFEHQKLTASRTGLLQCTRRIVTLLLQQIFLRPVTWITPACEAPGVDFYAARAQQICG